MSRDLAALVVASTFFVGMLGLMACSNVPVEPEWTGPTTQGERMVALEAELVQWLKDHGVPTARPAEGIFGVPMDDIRQITGNPKSAAACLDGIIYIDEHMAFNREIERALLLHELTHVAQGGCPIPKNRAERTQMEVEAYAMQRLYYKEKTGRTLNITYRMSMN